VYETELRARKDLQESNRELYEKRAEEFIDKEHLIKPESKPVGEKSEIEQMKEEQDKRAMGIKDVSERKFNKE
jgi:hypothetical protein